MAAWVCYSLVGTGSGFAESGRHATLQAVLLLNALPRQGYGKTCSIGAQADFSME